MTKKHDKLIITVIHNTQISTVYHPNVRQAANNGMGISCPTARSSK
jgi:hypothetical protein